MWLIAEFETKCTAFVFLQLNTAKNKLKRKTNFNQSSSPLPFLRTRCHSSRNDTMEKTSSVETYAMWREVGIEVKQDLIYASTHYNPPRMNCFLSYAVFQIP
jgi:hypothetical protein